MAHVSIIKTMPHTYISCSCNKSNLYFLYRTTTIVSPVPWEQRNQKVPSNIITKSQAANNWLEACSTINHEKAVTYTASISYNPQKLYEILQSSHTISRSVFHPLCVCVVLVPAHSSSQQYLIPAPDLKAGSKRHHYHYVALYSLWNYFVNFCEREQMNSRHHDRPPLQQQQQQQQPASVNKNRKGQQQAMAAPLAGRGSEASVLITSRQEGKESDGFLAMAQLPNPAARINEYNQRPRLLVFVDLSMNECWSGWTLINKELLDTTGRR